MKKLHKALAIGVLAATSAIATQAVAAPVFYFTEWAGFLDDGTPGTTALDFAAGDLITGDANLVPSATPIYDTVSWGVPFNDLNLQSKLELTTKQTPTLYDFGQPDGWNTISTLYHHNNVIQTAINWGPLVIAGRFNIYEGDPGVAYGSYIKTSDDPISINFTETANSNCAIANPTGSGVPCDDFFAFTADGLDSLSFTDSEGTNWKAEFQLANFVNSAILPPNSIYTAEGVISSLDVQVRFVKDVPEPATLGMLGLGLVGLSLAKRRKTA
jgi:hypothetical protein